MTVVSPTSSETNLLLSVSSKPPSTSSVSTTPEPTGPSTSQAKRGRKRRPRLTRVKNSKAKAQAKKLETADEEKDVRSPTPDVAATGSKRRRDDEADEAGVNGRRTRQRLDTPPRVPQQTPEPPTSDLNVRKLRGGRIVAIPDVLPSKRGTKRSQSSASPLEDDADRPSRKRSKSVEEEVPPPNIPASSSHSQVRRESSPLTVEQFPSTSSQDESDQPPSPTPPQQNVLSEKAAGKLRAVEEEPVVSTPPETGIQYTHEYEDLYVPYNYATYLPSWKTGEGERFDYDGLRERIEKSEREGVPVPPRIIDEKPGQPFRPSSRRFIMGVIRCNKAWVPIAFELNARWLATLDRFYFEMGRLMMSR